MLRKNNVVNKQKHLYVDSCLFTKSSNIKKTKTRYLEINKVFLDCQEPHKPTQKS